VPQPRAASDGAAGQRAESRHRRPAATICAGNDTVVTRGGTRFPLPSTAFVVRARSTRGTRSRRSARGSRPD